MTTTYRNWVIAGTPTWAAYPCKCWLGRRCQTEGDRPCKCWGRRDGLDQMPAGCCARRVAVDGEATRP